MKDLKILIVIVVLIGGVIFVNNRYFHKSGERDEVNYKELEADFFKSAKDIDSKYGTSFSIKIDEYLKSNKTTLEAEFKNVKNGIIESVSSWESSFSEKEIPGDFTWNYNLIARRRYINSPEFYDFFIAFYGEKNVKIHALLQNITITRIIKFKYLTVFNDSIFKYNPNAKYEEEYLANLSILQNKHKEIYPDHDPIYMCHIAFEGMPDEERIQRFFIQILSKYGMEYNDDNILKLGNALIVARKESLMNVTEMDIIEHVYKYGSPDIELHEQLAISAYLLERQ